MNDELEKDFYEQFFESPNEYLVVKKEYTFL
jgi:hypothetical protein